MIDNSWDGKSAGMILRKHISNRHVAQNMLERVAQNTEYSPPNEHLRIKGLLKSIISRGIIIVSTVTVIKVDGVIGGKLNVFEDAVDFLIMMVPAPKELVEAAHNLSAFNSHKRTTGVDFCYYKRESHDSLSEAQKEELREWIINKNNTNN